MDVDAGKYELKSQRKTKRQSMVDVFLGDRDFNHAHFAVIKKRNKQRHRGSSSCWNTCGTACQWVFRILFSVPVLIILAIVGTGSFLFPHLVTRQSSSNAANSSLRATPVPVTTAPIAKTPARTTTRDPATQSEAPKDDFAAPLFSWDQVKQRVTQLQGYLKEASSQVDLSAPSMVQAISWVAAYDPAMRALTTPVTQNHAVQRPAMAALFYATHPMTSASNVTRGSQHVSSRRRLSPKEWMTDNRVCQWHGVECENDDILHLNLTMRSLQGTLPSSLILATDLVGLDLSHNQLQGSLPAIWSSSFPRLKYVWLQHNQLTGELPPSISDWGDTVYHMDLSENGFSGSLPSTLGQLSKTRLLYLHQNQFEGKIALELGNLATVGAYG
jgi:hypothetical protein